MHLPRPPSTLFRASPRGISHANFPHLMKNLLSAHIIFSDAHHNNVLCLQRGPQQQLYCVSTLLSKSLAPPVRTWCLSEPNILYWRNYLWYCWVFSASPIVIRRRGIVPPPYVADLVSPRSLVKALIIIYQTQLVPLKKSFSIRAQRQKK